MTKNFRHADEMTAEQRLRVIEPAYQKARGELADWTILDLPSRDGYIVRCDLAVVVREAEIDGGAL